MARPKREHAVVEVGRDDHEPERAFAAGSRSARAHYDRDLDGGRSARPSLRVAALRPGVDPSPAATRSKGGRRLAAPAPPALGRSPARHADRSELGVRARNSDRPRLRRPLRRLARRRHPGPRARDRGAGLHHAVRNGRRAGRHPHGDRGQPAGDDRRRSDERSAHPERHLRLRDRHADPPVRLRRASRARHAAPDPRARRSASRDRARDHEDLTARGRGLGRVVALHRPIGTAARRGGVRRGQRRRGLVRQRPGGHRVPLRSRRLRPAPGRARRPRPALRGPHRHPRRQASRPNDRVAGAARPARAVDTPCSEVAARPSRAFVRARPAGAGA